jgi:hypothetical protein
VSCTASDVAIVANAGPVVNVDVGESDAGSTLLILI